MHLWLTDHTWPDAGISLLVLASPFHPASYIWNLVLSTSPQSPNQLPLWPVEPWKSQRRTDLALNFLPLLGVGTVPPGRGTMNGEEWPAYRHMVTQPARLTTVLGRFQSVILVEDRQELAPPTAGSSYCRLLLPLAPPLHTSKADAKKIMRLLTCVNSVGHPFPTE